MSPIRSLVRARSIALAGSLAVVSACAAQSRTSPRFAHSAYDPASPRYTGATDETRLDMRPMGTPPRHARGEPREGGTTEGIQRAARTVGILPRRF